METNITIKDALEMMRNELRQINVPAELVIPIGLPVTRTLGIINDCLFSIAQDEQASQAKQKGLFGEEDGAGAGEEPKAEEDGPKGQIFEMKPEDAPEETPEK